MPSLVWDPLVSLTQKEKKHCRGSARTCSTLWKNIIFHPAAFTGYRRQLPAESKRVLLLPVGPWLMTSFFHSLMLVLNTELFPSYQAQRASSEKFCFHRIDHLNKIHSLYSVRLLQATCIIAKHFIYQFTFSPRLWNTEGKQYFNFWHRIILIAPFKEPSAPLHTKHIILFLYDSDTAKKKKKYQSLCIYIYYYFSLA